MGADHTGLSSLGSQVAGCVFTPTELEKNRGLFHLRYCASWDQYQRLSNADEVIPGWERGVWRKHCVFRKVESDWQMVGLLLGASSLFAFNTTGQTGSEMNKGFGYFPEDI